MPLAYDSGGVTTSTVTVPLVTTPGLGLAEAIPGRSALLDRFGPSRAPVIQDRRVIGLISYSDIVLKGLKVEPEG